MIQQRKKMKVESSEEWYETTKNEMKGSPACFAHSHSATHHWDLTNSNRKQQSQTVTGTAALEKLQTTLLQCYNVYFCNECEYRYLVFTSMVSSFR
jgi:hypothetical protein